MPRHTRLRRHLLSFCPSLLLAAVAQLPAQTLLVVNQGESNLALVDPIAGQVVAKIAENTPGVHAHEVTISADGRTAFLPIYGSVGVGKPGLDGNEILVIDLPSRRIVAHITFTHGVRPHCPVLDPATGLLYVTTELDNTVTIIDPKSWKVLGTVPTGEPQAHMLAISHDGRRGYTANVASGTVSVLDLQQRRTLAVIPVAETVQRISISKDDRLVFTADQRSPRLAVIDTARNAVKTWVPLPGLGYGTAVTPDGRWLLITVNTTNKLVVIDLSTLQVARTLDLPSSPQEVVVQPDGKAAFVSCNQSGVVASIDLAHWQVGKLIPLGKLPDGMAWVPEKAF